MRRAKAKPRRTASRRAKPERATGRRAPAKRTAHTRAAATRTAARRTAKRAPGKRVAAKRPARRRPGTATAPAFPQAQGAPVRSQVMFRMVKARASVMAAVQGMSAATAEQPLGPGKWNTRETLLHLVTRDRARLREMEAALRGVQPSWKGLDPEGQAGVNEEDLAPLRALGWDEAKRLLLTTRQELMEAVESIPEQPESVWAEEHPLGWMFQRLPGHDLHHADIIKHWRTEHGA